MKIQLFDGTTDYFRNTFYRRGSQDYDCTAEEGLVSRVLGKLSTPSNPIMQVSSTTVRESETFPINNTHTIYYRESDGLMIKTSQVKHMPLGMVHGRISIEAYLPNDSPSAPGFKESFDRLRAPIPATAVTVA